MLKGRRMVYKRPPNDKVFFHSDQGSECTSNAFQSALKEHGLASSMSRAGNCV